MIAFEKKENFEELLFTVRRTLMAYSYVGAKMASVGANVLIEYFQKPCSDESVRIHMALYIKEAERYLAERFSENFVSKDDDANWVTCIPSMSNLVFEKIKPCYATSVFQGMYLSSIVSTIDRRIESAVYFDYAILEVGEDQAKEIVAFLGKALWSEDRTIVLSSGYVEGYLLLEFARSFSWNPKENNYRRKWVKAIFRTLQEKYKVTCRKSYTATEQTERKNFLGRFFGLSLQKAQYEKSALKCIDSIRSVQAFFDVPE